MDQDSGTDESRERALSSEPSSTRPNPFDEDDDNSNLSARKRRRTSLSGSRSTSVETALEPENAVATATATATVAAAAAAAAADAEAEADAASDPHDMKINTPEPTLPSTPAHPDHPDHPAEPVSSRVTINLRNADSIDATPTSPISPTPARQADHVRVSVEAPDVDMVSVRHPVDDASSSSSTTLDSPEPVGISIEDLEDDQFATIESPSSFRRTVDLSSIVTDFPYRYDGELPQETVARLLNYFRQRKSYMECSRTETIPSDISTPEPGNVDEGLLSIHSWFNQCVSCARPEFRTTIIETYRENRAFWAALPDMFYQFGQR